MTRISILGAAGRMGQSLLRCAARFEDIKVTAAVEAAGHPSLGQDAGLLAGAGLLGVAITTAERAAPADVVIDFTWHAAVPGNLEHAVAAGQACVLGTTGLSEAERQAVTAAAARIAIVQAPNMSLGVNLLLDLVRRAAAALDPAYDVEIVEMHHRLKKDAPSGTALGLAEAVAAGRGVDLKDVSSFGRPAFVPERPRGQIGLHAVRGGDVVGDHVVYFAADGERIEIAHRATSRDAFARGALLAARWLRGRPAGRYTMREVLGLA
jgi:4-hydroxy-tetrahydrodipicolinate reductase